MAEDVKVEFGADTSELEAGTQSAISEMERFEKAFQLIADQMEQMRRSVVEGFVDVELAVKDAANEAEKSQSKFKGLGGILGQLAGYLGAAFSVRAAYQWAQSMGEAAEELNNLSQRTGIAATDLSAWQAVARNTGVETQTLTTGIQILSKNLESARNGSEESADAFKVLGIDINTVKSNSELMLQIADRFKGMPDGPEKTALAMKVLGRSGAELIPLFNEGGDAISEAMMAAQESGLALSEQFIETGLQVDQAFDGMNNSVTALTNNLFEELGPTIADLVEGFTQWIEDMQGAEGQVTALDSVVTALNITLKAIGVVMGAVGVVITDVIVASTIIAITAISLLRATVISLGKALTGDFGGALSVWTDETDTAVKAITAQLDHAREVHKNYSEFLGETFGVTDNNKPGAAGGATPNAEGEAVMARLAEQRAEAERRRIEMERKAREQAAKAAAREEERIIREKAAFEIEQLNNQQDAVKNNFSAWNDIQNQKLEIIRTVYGEESRQYQQMLGEQQAAQRAAIEREAEVQRIRADSSRNTMSIQLQSERDLASGRIAIEAEKINTLRAMGQISEQEQIAALGALAQYEIDMERNLQQNLYQLRLEGLQAELDIANLLPEQRARINADIEALQAEHNARMAQLNSDSAVQASQTQSQAAQSVLASWQRVTQPVGQALGGMFQNLYNGTMSFRDALLQGLDQILFSFVNMGIQMATEWAAMELMKTTATTTGVAARTAAEATGAATTTAISAETALAQIANSAWVAASGAYAALASIPVIGPVIAPAAALAALGAVLAFAGNVFSAEGGWGRVPKDGMMTKLHEDEMVLPAQYASPLRDMLTGWGPTTSSPGRLQANAATMIESNDSLRGSTFVGGDSVLQYSPVANVQNRSLQQQLRTESRAMKKWWANQVRNGAVKVKGAEE